MILYALHLQAARYDRIIEPLLCMSIDFYVRLFVRIGYGSAKAQSQLGWREREFAFSQIDFQWRIF